MAFQSTHPQAPETAADRGSLPAMGSGLFRKEVLRVRSNQWLGKTSLAVPASFAIYSVSSIVLVVLIAAFLAFFSYSSIETVNAVIVPKSGITKVFGTESGVVVTRYVNGGERIRKGASIVSVRPQGEEGAQNNAAVRPVPAGRPGASAPVPVDASGTSAGVRDGGIDRRLESASDVESTVDIRAPADGMVYQVNKDVGENFYDFEYLASIAADGDLSVSALVSPAAHARLEIGTPVRMELEAFSGRRIGMLSGQVIAIATGPTERGDSPMRKQEHAYEVVVLVDLGTSSLPREKLLGKVVKIRFPMQKRKLYEWLLDPLQALF